MRLNIFNCIVAEAMSPNRYENVTKHITVVSTLLSRRGEEERTSSPLIPHHLFLEEVWSVVPLVALDQISITKHGLVASSRQRLPLIVYSTLSY